MTIIGRRAFLARSTRAAGLGAFTTAPAATLLATAPPLRKTYRCATIGSTGRGGFGHGLDRVFSGLPGVEFVALADDDPAGLQAVGQRTGVKRLYLDYREMLKQEQLDVICVATRQVTLHEEMVIACAQAGKHIYCEKPLASDLAAADRMLKACHDNGVKIAVALPNRASLAIRRALELVRSGRLGRCSPFALAAKRIAGLGPKTYLFWVTTFLT